MRTGIEWAHTPAAVEHALERLRRGEVIAIPTDTVYGVATDGFNPEGIDKLFAVKARPRNKPIPLLLADAADLEQVALHIPREAMVLAGRFWPGGLTLVVRANEHVPAILRAEGDSVAVRVPDHPVPRDLARALGRPLAATSANISGGPNPSTAQEVELQLGGRIGLILDGGTVGAGLPSTVVDLTVTPPRVLRAGALPIGEIEGVLGLKITANVDWN
jgi:L-threonylcarbamoyladenylate synthase